MKIGKFICSREQFNRIIYLKNKFNYDMPIQIVGAVHHSVQGVLYLAIKHNQVEGSANYTWFSPSNFRSLAEGVDILKLIPNQGGNQYYWIQGDLIRLTVDTKHQSKASLGAMVLRKFEEEDE
jgi:hypothetical protein